MIRRILLNIGLFIFLGSAIQAQIPSFTEDFSSSGNLSSYNFQRSGGWARNELIHAYYRTDSWSYQWGDIAYYNGYIYAVWADNREDGVNHIYLDKIGKDGTHIYSTNIPLDDMINPCYRPKISIADSSHIYVVYIEDQTEYRRFYAMRFEDTGASLTKMWGSPVKLDVYDDPKFAVSAQYKTSCDTIGNNLVAFMNQSWSGSWGYESLRYVRADGSLGGESHGYVTGDHGSYGSDILVNGGNSFLTVRERYYWGGSDEGIWGRRWQTNSSGGLSSVWGGKDLDSKGTILSGAADQNVQAIDCNGTNFFAVWNDRRNGNHDIFLGKYLYSDGNRASGFDPEIRVNISSAGEQKNPDITKDYLNLLYIVWADAGASPSWQLEMMKLQDDGVKKFGGDFTLERSTNESYIRGFNPRIASDNTNLYVAWYQYGGSDDYRIMVQKYDSSGGRLWSQPVSLMQGTYMRRSHGDSAKLIFTPKAATIKEVMVTNFNYSEPGDGKAKLYLSNNAGANWFLATNGHAVLFTNTTSGGYLAGWDFRYKLVFESDGLGAQPGVDGFTLKAYQYYTGDFLYTMNTNLNYAGSNVLESFGVTQSMTNYILADGTNKGVYYVKLKNTGNGSGNFYIYGETGGGNFDVKYYAGSQDITANITSWTGYLVTSLGTGVGTNIRVEVTPSPDTHEGEYYTFYLYSYVGQGSGIHDSLKMTSYCWKYKPDLLIKKNAADSYIGASVFEKMTTILTQRIGTNANSFLSDWEEYHTNFLALRNSGISNDIITFETQIVSGNLSSWSMVYTNLTKHQVFTPPCSFSNIAPNQSNIIAIIHKPLSLASVGENLKLRFLIKSEKTAISDDPLRLDYAFWSNRAKKYEPDVFVTFDNFTVQSGENIYSYTNASVTQAILKKTVPGTPLYFNVIVQNDGDDDDIFYLNMDSIQNNGWTAVYSNNAQDMTHALTNALGTNIPLSSHTSMTILCKYLTTTNVPSGQWHNLKFQAISLSKPFYRDACYVRPYNKILRPDLIVAKDTNSWFGENIYSTTGVEQSGYTRLESVSEDTQVYFLKVKNNSQTDPDTIYLQGSKDDSHWHIHYYTNSIDITSAITQCLAFSLNTNQFTIVRAVVKVDPTAAPDERKNLHFHIWSSEVPSQEDRAVFTNQAVELKPDLVVAGVGDGQYRSSTYEQSRYFEAINGLTNSGIVLLQNDGGSVESFRLQGIFTNFGGSLTNWIISIKVGTTEVVSSITNTGFVVSNLSAYDATNLSFKIYAKPYSVGDTNSAVGNFLYMKFMWMSETKNSRRDLGQIENEIKRGLVDSFIMPGNVSYGVVTTNFLPNTNRYILGIVPGYPANASFYMKNTGIYTDVFNSYIKTSNISPAWNFSVTNDGANITSIITNSASPYTFTNKDGYSKSLKLTLDATNGTIVGTKVYFKNYFQTSTKWERKDCSYIMGIIVDGLPDLACSNRQTQQIVGWGKDASVESLSDKIEETETNEYCYLLHNDVVGGSNANFIFKEQQRLGTANADVHYFTNDILIPNSTISNGLVVNIASGSNIKVKMTVSLPGALSGTESILKHSLSLQGYSQVEDSYAITNIKVYPSVYLGFEMTTSATQMISSTNDKVLTYTFIVTNNDVVQEQFHVKAEAGTPDWQISYYYANPSSGTYSNVTSVLTNTGFLTPNLLGSQKAEFKANLYLSTNLYGETNRLFHVQAFSLKNVSRSNSLNYGAIVKDGIPDIYGTNRITSSVAGYNQSSTNELLFDDIEVLMTNKYRLYLRNQDNYGQGTFLFKLISMTTNPGWKIQSYSSSSSLLSLSDLSNGFYVTNNGGQRDYVDIYIVATNTNLVSGSGLRLSYGLNLKDYPSKMDSFSITNRLVKPAVYLGFKTSSLSEQKTITTNNHTISFQFIVTNKDLVPARFFVSAPSGNNDWSNTYYYDKNPDPLYTDYTNISPFVTSSTGYLTKLINGNIIEEFKIDLCLSSNIPGMSSNLFPVRAYTYKNHSISNHIAFGALIHEGTPDLSISNTQSHIVESHSTRDKIQIGQTNSYVVSLLNAETGGGRGLFMFDESLKIGDTTWQVQYFTNHLLLPDVTNQGYKLWLNANQTKKLTMQVVITNTNLISSSQLIIKNHFYLSNYSEQRSVYSAITNTLVKPGVSIYLKNISQATLYKTNNQRIFVKLAVKNTDLVNDRFIVKGSSGVTPWNTVYSNTNLITSFLTNTTGWTTRSLGAYAEDYIKCYIDLDSSLGGNTNRTFSFSAMSMADTSKTDTLFFTIFIIDGIPELKVSHNSIIYSNSPDKVKIETFETNTYVYILSNAAQKGSGEFVFRKTYSSKPHAVVDYSTNNWTSTIASSNLIKGISYNLAGGESRRIAMRVSLSNSCPSSTKILEYNQVYLKAVPGFVDKTYVTNVAVAPQMGLQYEDGTVATNYLVSTNNAQKNYTILLKNLDRVSEQAYFRCVTGNSSDWHLEFIRNTTGQTLTSFVTSLTGWLTPDLNYLQTESIRVELTLSSNLYGNTNYLVQWRASPLKNTNVITNLYLHVKIDAGQPILSVTNLTQSAVSSNSWFDKMEIDQTNTYIYRLKNSEPAGQGTFAFKEISRDALDNWTVEYFDGATKLSNLNAGYYFDLNAGETKNIRMNVTLTNTNLSSGGKLILNNLFYLSNYQVQYFKEFSITNKFVKPGVSITLDNISSSTVFWTNNQTEVIRLKIKNNDIENDKIIVSATPGLPGWFSVYSNNSSDITAQITNVTGWTSASYAGYSVDTIKLYLHLGSNLSGMTNKTFKFKAESLNNTQRTDTISFTVSIVDGSPKLDVYNFQSMSYSTNIYEKIEGFETNSYVYVLSNTATAGKANFVFQGTPVGDHGVFEFFTNSTTGAITNAGFSPVTLPDIQNGLVLSVPGNDRRLIKVKIHTTNAPSAELEKLDNFRFYLKGYLNSIDFTTIRNRTVSPNVSFAYSHTVAKTNVVFTTNHHSISYSLIIKNNDEVDESFRLKALGTNLNDWHLGFISTYNNQDITANVFSTNGWLTPELSAHASVQVDLTLTLSSNLKGKTNRLFAFAGAPVKNLTLKSNLYLSCNVIDGIPKLSVLNHNETDGIKFSTKSTNLVSFTYVLSNLAGDGVADFKFAEIEKSFYDLYNGTNISSNTGFKINYKTNGVPIVNTNFIVSIPGQSSVQVDVTLQYTNVDFLGKQLSLRHKLYLMDTASGIIYSMVYDSFSITNYLNNPYLSLHNAGYSTNVVAFNSITTNNQTISYIEVISNNDVINGTYHLSGSAGDINWGVQYIRLDTDQDISTDVANGVNIPIPAQSALRIQLNYTLTTNLLGGNTNTLSFKVENMADTNLKRQHTFFFAVIDGLPDIIVSDIQNQSKFGAGLYALSQQKAFEKIERSETNVYVLSLSNYAKEGGSAVFYVKLTNKIQTGSWSIKFYDAQTNLDITSNMTNGSYIRIKGKFATNLIAKVSSQLTNLSSSNVGFQFVLALSNYVFLRDVVAISNIGVAPQCEVGNASGNDKIWDFSDYKNAPGNFTTVQGSSIAFYFGVQNQDAVHEQFILKAPPGNSHFTVRYYLDGMNIVDLTPLITTTGYTTSQVAPNDFFRIRCSVTPTIDTALGGVYTNYLLAKPVKNTNITATNEVKVTVDYYLIHGFIKHVKDGSAIANATIVVHSAFGTSFKGKSDNNGYYSINLYSSKYLYSIQIDADGFVGKEISYFTGSRTNNLSVSLVPFNMNNNSLDLRLFPNPLSSGESGNFVYSVTKSGPVAISIYDMHGHLVRNLVDENKDPGVYYKLWDGTGNDGAFLSRGLYIMFIKTSEGIVRKKIAIK